jgi:hypothetical protein
MNELTNYPSSVHDAYSQHMSKNPSSQKLNDTNSTTYDLQDIIQQYQSTPELLKLILTSKVEEDKRKAEEAKLRAKELDLYLQHGNQPPSPEASPRRLSVSSLVEEQHLPSAKESRKMSVSTTHSLNRTSPYPIPRHTTSIKHQKHNSFSSESSLDSLDDPHQQRRHSAAAAMLAMGGSFPTSEVDSQMDVCLSPTERYDENFFFFDLFNLLLHSSFSKNGESNL